MPIIHERGGLSCCDTLTKPTRLARLTAGGTPPTPRPAKSTPPRATASDHMAALPRQQRRSVDIIGGAAAIGDVACAWHHGAPRIHHRDADSWRAHGCMTLQQKAWRAQLHMSTKELSAALEAAEVQGDDSFKVALDACAAARWLYPDCAEWLSPMSARLSHALDGAAAAGRMLMCDAAVNSLLLLAPQPRGELIEKLKECGVALDNLPLSTRYGKSLFRVEAAMHSTAGGRAEHHPRDMFIANHATVRHAVLVTADWRAIACPAVQTCWDVTQ